MLDQLLADLSTLAQVLAFLAGVGTLATNYLSGRKLTIAWVVGLVGNAFWWWYMIHTGTWALLPLIVGMLYVHIKNLVRWSRDDTPWFRYPRPDVAVASSDDDLPQVRFDALRTEGDR